MKEEKEVAIEAYSIRKIYGKHIIALNNVSLQVKKGEIFALLGPNGAGKTTLTRILSTLLLPTSGAARIMGYDLLKDKRAIRKIVGYMPQNYVLYDDLTARENLQFFGSAYGLKGKELAEKVDEVLAFTELDTRATDLFHTFSGGMKQRLSLACALLHHPAILFLDEPTAGVDLKLRKAFWDYFHELSKKGVTIFVTTHQMDEVEYCERVCCIHRGNIILDDTPENIKKLGRKSVIISTPSGKESYLVQDYRKQLPQIFRSLGDKINDIESIDFEESSLEEILRERIM